MNLREAKGYTYGARATLAQRRGAGALLARTSVQADKTGPALREIFAEVAGLTQRPVTDQELALARDGELRGVPGLFETGEIMAGIMASLFTLELPLDRVQRRVRAYRDLTREQVQQAAQAYFVPGLMQVVLVGDPAVVKAQVPALGLGEIRRREPPR
jgi:predicted Zn-dependent peptidase